jgi:hypothetical protein
VRNPSKAPTLKASISDLLKFFITSIIFASVWSAEKILEAIQLAWIEEAK